MSREPVTLPDPVVVTPEEYDAMQPPNARIELIDGVIHVMTPATTRHQKLVDRLLRQLEDRCPADLEAVREQEIRLEDDHRRNPDLLVVNAEAVDPDGFSYQPKDVVLAIEVVSKGTRTADRKHKPVEYADAGIPFFWRIEPEPLEVHVFQLGDAGRYEPAGVFRPGDVIVAPGLEWADIAVADLTR